MQDDDPHLVQGQTWMPLSCPMTCRGDTQNVSNLVVAMTFLNVQFECLFGCRVHEQEGMSKTHPIRFPPPTEHVLVEGHGSPTKYIN